MTDNVLKRSFIADCRDCPLSVTDLPGSTGAKPWLAEPWARPAQHRGLPQAVRLQFL